MSEARHKKVIVIGDGCVGKTCFVSKVTENKFIPNYLPTLGGNGTSLEILRVQLTLDSPLSPSSYLSHVVEYGVKTIRRDDHDVKLKVLGVVNTAVYCVLL